MKKLKYLLLLLLLAPHLVARADVICSSAAQTCGLGLITGTPTFSGVTTFSDQIRLSNGTATEPSLVFTSDDDATGTGIYRSAADTLAVTANGVGNLFLSASTLELYRSTTAQRFSVYNTRTDATNYERLNIDWASNVARVVVAAAGSGASRSLVIGTELSSTGQLRLQVGGTNRWFIDTTAALQSSTDNGGDIGSLTQRARTGYFGTSILTPLTGGPAGSGSNAAGTALAVAGGQSTGTGAGGNLQLRTSPSGASGSSANASIDRSVYVAQAKTLTEGAATTFVQVPVAASAVTGGRVEWTVEANDGVDFQARTGSFYYSAVNKANTETCDVQDIPTSAAGLSAGTLTVSITCDTSATDAINLQANATSSLTQTTLRMFYTITQHGGGQNVSPQ